MANHESELSSLLSSASLVLVGGMFGSVAQLVEKLLIGRTLAPSVYGDVSIAIAVLTFGVMLSALGFTQGVPRYVSRFDREADVRGAWVTGIALTGVLALVAVAVFTAGSDRLVARLFEERGSSRLVRLFVLSIPFVVGLQIGLGAIRGLENTIYKTYVQDLLYPLGRILVLLVLLSSGYGILAAGYAYLAAAIVAFVAAHVLLNRLIPLVGEFETHSREMLVFSAPLVVATLLSVLLTQTDTLMLGYFRSSHDVGLYNAAYPLANAMLVLLSAFGFLYLPLASRLDSNGERAEVREIYQITTKWIYVVTFPAFLAFVAFSGDVIRIFWGVDYTGGALALSVLSVGFFTSAAAGRNRETISALGETKYIALANGVAFALNVVLNVLLIPRYGITGAAVASAVSYVALNVTVCAILKRRFDISVFTPSSIRTYVLLPLTLLPPTALAARWISLTAVTLPVFLVATGLASIAVVSLTGGLQPEDRIALEFVEDLVGTRVPLIRRYLPASVEKARTR